MGIGEGRHVEAFVVAKYFSADTYGQPIINGVGQILGNPIGVGISAIVARKIENR